MSRFTTNPSRFTPRLPRFGPWTPPVPGTIPALSLLTEAGHALVSQHGAYLLQEAAVGSAVEGAILTEAQTLLATQGQLYLKQE